jgi:hypothetical protein
MGAPGARARRNVMKPFPVTRTLLSRTAAGLVELLLVLGMADLRPGHRHDHACSR